MRSAINGKTHLIEVGFKIWSAREDSNLRPTGPKPVALPSCATRRNFCSTDFYSISYLFSWCERGDLNPHVHRTLTPEASASTNSATLAMSQKNGVANGTRTHDNWNHNPGLYQLSYSHHNFTFSKRCYSTTYNVILPTVAAY